MTVTKLVRCGICGRRAHPVKVVMVHDNPAHPACAEAHYKRLAEVLGVGCSRAEGGRGV